MAADKKVVAPPKKEVVPSDIADQLQTMRNEKAAADYEKRKAGVPSKKAGGTVKMAKGGTASSRADGCCTKGKTRGKMM
jgi:hypothetical protein